MAKKNMERKRPDRVSFSEQYADVLAPNSLVYRMKLLSQLMERRFQQMLEPFQLTPLHWAVLCCLWQSDGMPTVALGRRLGQLRGTLVVVLDAMERTGYLSRRQDKNDQRISRIFLTKQGRQLMTQLPPMAQELQRQSFHPLSPREIDMLSKQVDILLKKTRPAALGRIESPSQTNLEEFWSNLDHLILTTDKCPCDHTNFRIRRQSGERRDKPACCCRG